MKVRTVLKYLNLGYQLEVNKKYIKIVDHQFQMNSGNNEPFAPLNASLDEFIIFCNSLPETKIAEMQANMIRDKKE